MIYIGIDPGKSGAVVVLKDRNIIGKSTFTEESIISVLKMVEKQVRIYKQSCVCCLEKVGARPHQGVVSMFNFGQNFGFIQGVLKTLEIPFELVSPQRWKKEFGLTGEKEKSIEVAKRLFPNVDLRRTDKCKKDDDGLAEALLMAEYARRKL